MPQKSEMRWGGRVSPRLLLNGFSRRALDVESFLGFGHGEIEVFFGLG
jgi:hypothetical protein